jgi:hypothetical protein
MITFTMELFLLRVTKSRLVLPWTSFYRKSANPGGGKLDMLQKWHYINPSP